MSLASTVARTQTSSRIPHGHRHHPSAERVCAGHRPAAEGRDGRLSHPSLDTPARYMRRASDQRFRWSEALSSTRWQVKDSNLRSFRDGFTVPRLQDRDQRKRLTRNNFRAYSPQIADDHRLPPDTSASNPHSRRRATTSSRTLQTATYPARANTSRDRLSGRAPPRQDRFTRMPQMAHIASLPEVTGKRLR
jgi:hypothetical protein